MGPLAGLRVVEMAGIGPAPFCGMLLADLGAEVARIDRLAASGLGVAFPQKFDLLNRNKQSLAVDLKTSKGLAAVHRMIGAADVLIEGFRPGVMEKLGLGPDAFEQLNPRLVYGRMTGWGQDGPLAKAAGHDINYIAISGALHAIGRKGEPPAIPLNLVGDFGGGTLYLVMGILAAVIDSRRSGRGQTVDAAVVDGVANLMTMQHALCQMGEFTRERGVNLIDGGAPFYDVYETRDGLHVSVGAIEPKFYQELIERMGLAGEALPEQYDRENWPRLRGRFAEVFRTRTRSEWCDLLEGTDACFAPVLDLEEAASHSQNVARANLVDVDGVRNPAPAPRFSRTPASLRAPPSAPGGDSLALLSDWGFSRDDIAALRAANAIA